MPDASADATTQFAQRRARLLERIGTGAVLIPAAPEAVRNNDVLHEYRQDSDLHYLTGFDEPHSLLLLTTQHDEHRAVMFLRKRDKERETWDGYRLGVERAVETLGVDAAFPIEELEQKLADYLKNVTRLHYTLGQSAARDRTVLRIIEQVKRLDRKGVVAPSEIIDARRELAEMRLRKSSAELELMRTAAAITAEAHRRAMETAKPGRYEYEVEAELLRVFRARGAERPAYGSIVGSGVNATVLHYRSNDRQLQDGDLLLIDAGAEYGYYASDVTRTFPVNGRFSPPQREIYELVLSAQQAAVASVRPGATYKDVHNAALTVLTQGMIDLGFIEGPLDKAIEEERYKPYFMHGTSHWLGMDVHDVGLYSVDKQPRKLEPGMVLTVEPGLYIAPDADVDIRYRGIGVRIEDDVAVTRDGHENLTAAIPKTVQDLEQLLQARAD